MDCFPASAFRAPQKLHLTTRAPFRPGRVGRTVGSGYLDMCAISTPRFFADVWCLSLDVKLLKAA